MKNLKKVSVCGALGVIFFVTSSIIAGLQLSDYSHISQIISESYAMGTPYGLYLRLFGFIPSGILLSYFGFNLTRQFPKSGLAEIGFYGIAIFYGVATVVVSIFPCDKGCNKELMDPSVSQLIHNLFGGLTYLFVPCSLLLIGIAAVKWQGARLITVSGIACGLVSMIFVGVLTSNQYGEYLGLVQRIIEGSILLFILICSVYLQKLPDRAAASTA